MVAIVRWIDGEQTPKKLLHHTLFGLMKYQSITLITSVSNSQVSSFCLICGVQNRASLLNKDISNVDGLPWNLIERRYCRIKR